MPFPKRQFCPKGHDTHVTGRNAISQGCNVCAVERARDWHRKKRETAAGSKKPANCEVCGEAQTPKNMHFDHDHETGKFRGWLCTKCNTALGLANDSPELLLKLALYLEKHKCL